MEALWYCEALESMGKTGPSCEESVVSCQSAAVPELPCEPLGCSKEYVHGFYPSPAQCQPSLHWEQPDFVFSFHLPTKSSSVFTVSGVLGSTAVPCARIGMSSLFSGLKADTGNGQFWCIPQLPPAWSPLDRCLTTSFTLGAGGVRWLDLVD